MIMRTLSQIYRCTEKIEYALMLQQNHSTSLDHFERQLLQAL